MAFRVPRPHVRLTPKRLLIGSTGLVIAVGLVLIVHSLTAPVHGRPIANPQNLKLSRTSPKPVPAVAAAALPANSYVKLSLPAGFQPQASSSTPTGLLFAQTILKESIDGSQILSIAIKTLPSGGISGDSSYALRTSQPANYSASTLPAAGESVVVMTALNSDGVVAFWAHHSFEATISVTTGLGDGGSSEASDELTTLKQILADWQWLQ